MPTLRSQAHLQVVQAIAKPKLIGSSSSILDSDFFINNTSIPDAENTLYLVCNTNDLGTFSHNEW